MVREDRFLEVNDIHEPDFLECSANCFLRCILGLPEFGVTGGCPAPYGIEAEARLSINLALLRGVQTPDTPPPPGNSLIPIKSVFPAGWLRGPLKPIQSAYPVVPQLPFRSPAWPHSPSTWEKEPTPRWFGRMKEEALRIAFHPANPVKLMTSGLEGKRCRVKPSPPSLDPLPSRMLRAVSAHRAAFLPACPYAAGTFPP